MEGEYRVEDLEAIAALTDDLIAMRDEHPSPYGTRLSLLVEIRDEISRLQRITAIDAVVIAGISRREVAKLTGMHPITIGRWVLAHQAEVSE